MHKANVRRSDLFAFIEYNTQRHKRYVCNIRATGFADTDMKHLGGRFEKTLNQENCNINLGS